MCNSDALRQLLEIASQLAGLTASRLKAMQEQLYSSSTLSSSDGIDMEAELSYDGNDMITQKIINVFLSILHLLKFLSDKPDSKSTLIANILESINILNSTVNGFPGYRKADMDETINSLLQDVLNQYKDDAEVSKNLILCKRSIFE